MYLDLTYTTSGFAMTDTAIMTVVYFVPQNETHLYMKNDNHAII